MNSEVWVVCRKFNGPDPVFMRSDVGGAVYVASSKERAVHFLTEYFKTYNGTPYDLVDFNDEQSAFGCRQDILGDVFDEWYYITRLELDREYREGGAS